MRIGGSLFLLALGAILAFAVSDMIPNVDLTLVGYILMGVGAIGLIVSLFMTASARTGGRVSETRTAIDPATGETVRRDESRDI